MNLVERVARLLCVHPDSLSETDVRNTKTGEWGRVRTWQMQRARARRILEAMREDPMAAQLRADAPRAIGTWHTIIDAELAADLDQHGAAMTHANDDWPQPYAITVAWFDPPVFDFAGWMTERLAQIRMTEPEWWGIAANVVTDKQLRRGAKVTLVLRMGHDRFKVSGLSIGGRRIEKIVALKNLTKFRPQWLPPGSNRRVIHVFLSRAQAQAAAAALGGAAS